MDGINLIRIIFTVLSFVCFLLIAFWAYSKTSKKQFDEAANLPFADDEGGSQQADGTRSPSASDGSKKMRIL